MRDPPSLGSEISKLLVKGREQGMFLFLSVLVAIADIDHCWSKLRWFLFLAVIEIYQVTGLLESN